MRMRASVSMVAAACSGMTARMIFVISVISVSFGVPVGKLLKVLSNAETPFKFTIHHSDVYVAAHPAQPARRIADVLNRHEEDLSKSDSYLVNSFIDEHWEFRGACSSLREY